MEETASLAPARSLFTAKDRCDRCGAQAKTMVLFVAGPLLFCGHHTKAYMTDLLACAAEIESEEE
ncbi:MAG TPA: hypothetical protein VF867_17850 [Arthrobacter sp.]